MAGGCASWETCVAEGGVCIARDIDDRGVHTGGGACMDGRRDGHCSRRYVSYWDAFLFHEYSSAMQHSPVLTREIARSKVCSSLVTHSIKVGLLIMGGWQYQNYG